jgi:class 3 adenylate cyclase/predicted ATPase
MPVVPEPQHPGASTQPPAAERRQLTVLFIDIADSTELSERLDPDEFFTILSRYRETCDRMIRRFEGHIARTVGDGLLAYFGLPQAHADAPERAVHAALSIAEALREQEFATAEAGPVKLDVRIAVNTGLVVVGGLTGEAGFERRDVFGTPAHIGDRLQALAPLNRVVIGPATYERVRGAFRCSLLANHMFKGVKDPVAVWLVDGVLCNEGRFEKARTAPLTPMIGRTAERATLVGLWARAAAGSGGTVAVSGEPGIGKSRLIQELRSALADEEKETLYFQCSELHTNTPLAPLIERDRRQAGLAPNDSPDEMVAKLRDLLSSVTPDTQSLMRYYGALLSIPACGDYAPADLRAPGERERALQVIADVVVGLSRRLPVLIVVEDVQWIDPTSVDLLERLMARIGRERVLLIVTHRDGFKPYWLVGGKALQMPLARLEAGECGEMVEVVAGGAAMPGAMVRSIVEHADGVPLYIEELTRSVLDRPAQRANGGAPPGGRLKEPPVPPSLQDLLMERLDRLGEAKRIVQEASIFGRQFDYEGLLHILDMPKRDLARALRDLEQADLLRRIRKSPGTAFAFKHAMIQQAAYDSLLKDVRASLHARAAQWLQRSVAKGDGGHLAVLGHHYARAGMIGEAVAAWLDAGREALARAANREAVASLWQGVELVSKLSDEEERSKAELMLQAHLAMAYTAMAGWAAPQVDRPYTRALELCRSYGTAREKAIVLWGAAIAALVSSRLDKAVELAEEFIALAEEWGDEEAVLLANTAAVLANFFLGRLAQAKAAARLVCDRYDPARHAGLVQRCQHDPKVVALVYLGHIEWLLGDPQAARAACEAARRLARELGHPFMLAFALILGACDHLYERELEANLACIEEGMEAARRHGLSMFGIFGPLWAMPSLVARDPEPATLENLWALISRLLENNCFLQAPLYEVFLACELGRAGQVDRGRTLAASAEALMQRTGERWFEPELYRVRGVLAALSPHPDHAQAAELFRRSLASARALGAIGWALRTAIDFAGLLRDLGDRGGACAVLAEARGAFARGARSADLREADRLLAELGGVPLARAVGA